MFKLDLNLPFFAPLSPKQLMSGLAKDIQELQRDIVAIQNELKKFQIRADLSIKRFTENLRYLKSNYLN